MISTNNAVSKTSSNKSTTVTDSCSFLFVFSRSEPLASSSAAQKLSAASASSSSAKTTGLRGASKSSVASSAGSASASANDPTSSPYRTSEFYIIRVSIGGAESDSRCPETEGVIMYKSIMIGNHERTREVVRSAMMKHGLEGAPESYTLSQVLPEGKGETAGLRLECFFRSPQSTPSSMLI